MGASASSAQSSDNDLDLFAQEFDTRTGQLPGNSLQALAHLAHIAAAVALKKPIDGVGDAGREVPG
jgi:hypothetical protein